jgi:cytochrome c oxidase accessory protein FixG
MSAPHPVPHELVLPTLNPDGTRRRIRPKLYQGRIYKRRAWVGWGLIALFVVLPFIRIGGLPAILLDVAAREFTFFGRTFFATDGVLLMLLMLSIFVGIIGLTALIGRAWCGWGCPQTVYMEFLFRPIERLFEGDRNAQLKLDEKGGGWRRIAKNAVFLLLSVVVANVFLAYFVGVETLGTWIASSPSAHPGGFLVMGTTAGLVFFNFAYFREQMCTVICPYARLQAALLDRDSLIIGYDEKRGEPRHKGKSRAGDGDCVDCSACVVTCPTGIDIREGLQLECIACGQCVDACDSIMPRVKKPLGLIRYASQSTLSGGKSRVIRPRVVAYSLLILALVSALLIVGSGRGGAEVTVLRGIGAPFVLDGDTVRNQVRVKVENRGTSSATFDIEVLAVSHGVSRPLADLGASAIIPENPLEVAGRDQRTTSMFLLAPKSSFQGGRMPIVVRVSERGPEGANRGSETTEVSYHMLGPSVSP